MSAALMTVIMDGGGAAQRPAPHKCGVAELSDAKIGEQKLLVFVTSVTASVVTD
jgi:hypothetical protein